jgi:hypothetical protein
VNGEDDNFLAGIALQYAPAGLDTADAGHADIHQDDIGIEFLREHDTSFAAVSFTDDADLTAVFQQAPNTGSHQRVVVY